jgi:predicted phosphodiesterase
MYFIGDVHGKTEQLVRKVNALPRIETKIQVGDMGLGFKGTLLPHLDYFYFIRGNHDSPQVCQVHPNYLGDFGFSHIYSMFWMSGAWSIDYKIRTPGVTWWPDEELSYTQLNQAFNLYQEKKPRIVVTHETPEAIGRILMSRLSLVGDFYYSGNTGVYIQSRTSQILQQMFDIHKPEVWVFGHYHIDETIPFQGTQFHCLNELSVKEIRLE